MALVLSEIVTEIDDIITDAKLTTAMMQRQVGLINREVHQRTNQQFLKREGTFNTAINVADYNLEGLSYSGIAIFVNSTSIMSTGTSQGWAVGEVVTVTGTVNNNGTYKITVVSGANYTLDATLTDETVSCTVKRGLASLDGQKVFEIRPPSTTFRVVEYLPYDQFYQNVANWVDDYGDPIIWTWEDWQTLRFNPIPNAVGTYTVLYQKLFTEINEDSDDDTTIDIPDKYRNVLVDGALWRCARIVDEEREPRFKNDYEEAKARMLHDLAPDKGSVKPDPRLITSYDYGWYR